MKNGSYVVIQDWMITELGLKGTDLIVYALVWGFSQDGHSTFRGSLNYVAGWVGGRRNTGLAALKRLQKAGLIENVASSTHTAQYRAFRHLSTTGAENAPVEGDWCGKRTKLVRKTHQTGAESAPNNNTNNLSNNDDVSTYKDIKGKAPDKRFYGLRVFGDTRYGKEIRKDNPEMFDKLINGETGYRVELIEDAITKTSEAMEAGRDIRSPMSYVLSLLKTWSEEEGN